MVRQDGELNPETGKDICEPVRLGNWPEHFLEKDASDRNYGPLKGARSYGSQMVLHLVPLLLVTAWVKFMFVARNKYASFFICNTLKHSVIQMVKKCDMSWELFDNVITPRLNGSFPHISVTAQFSHLWGKVHFSLKWNKLLFLRFSMWPSFTYICQEILSK